MARIPEQQVTRLKTEVSLDGLRPVGAEPTLFATLPTADPSCAASRAFRSVAHPHRTIEYASGALGHKTPWPQHLSAPRNGTMENKVG